MSVEVDKPIPSPRDSSRVGHCTHLGAWRSNLPQCPPTRDEKLARRVDDRGAEVQGRHSSPIHRRPRPHRRRDLRLVPPLRSGLRRRQPAVLRSGPCRRLRLVGLDRPAPLRGCRRPVHRHSWRRGYERIWVPPVYDRRAIYDRCGRVISYRTVLVSNGYWRNQSYSYCGCGARY